jgi:hypothetical protein
MRILALVALLSLGFGFWLAVDQKSDEGKNPEDEEIVLTQERNKVTGELYNVEIVRCKICGQVISYKQFNLHGKLVYARKNRHDCGNVHYQNMALDPQADFLQWLEGWQKRLRLKR